MIFVFCECKTFRMTQESHNVSIKVTNHLEGIFQCHGVCRNIFIEEKMECLLSVQHRWRVKPLNEVN